MKNISDFFRTTSVSKLEFHDGNIEEFFISEALPRSLLQEAATTPDAGPRSATLKRADSIRDRWSRQFNAVHRASMRHRSIVLDSNDAGMY